MQRHLGLLSLQGDVRLTDGASVLALQPLKQTRQVEVVPATRPDLGVLCEAVHRAGKRAETLLRKLTCFSPIKLTAT